MMDAEISQKAPRSSSKFSKIRGFLRIFHGKFEKHLAKALNLLYNKTDIKLHGAPCYAKELRDSGLAERNSFKKFNIR